MRIEDEEKFQIALVELLGVEALAGDKLSFHDVARMFYRRGLIDGGLRT